MPQALKPWNAEEKGSNSVIDLPKILLSVQLEANIQTLYAENLLKKNHPLYLSVLQDFAYKI